MIDSPGLRSEAGHAARTGYGSSGIDGEREGAKRPERDDDIRTSGTDGGGASGFVRSGMAETVKMAEKCQLFVKPLFHAQLKTPFLSDVVGHMATRLYLPRQKRGKFGSCRANYYGDLTIRTGQNEHKKTAPGGAVVGGFTLRQDPRRSHRAGRADCPHQGEALRARFSRCGSSLQKTDRSLLHNRGYNPQRCSFPAHRSHQCG